MAMDPISAAGDPKVLFLPHLDVLAHTGRSLLVAAQLASRGCRVSFAGGGKYARLVREAGFPVHGLPEMPATEIVRQSKRGRRWPFHSAAQIQPFVAAEVDLIENVKPDVVVFDHRYTAGLSAEIARTPRVSITNLWWTPYDATGMGLPETHPIFASFPLLLFIRRFRLAWRASARVTDSLFSKWARPYNEVRRQRGLAPIGSVLDLFKGDEVILPDTPLLTPAKDLPENYHYVGPLVWEPRMQLPDELNDQPGYVYVTMGSSADPRVFEIALAALRLLPGVRAVVTTGGVRKPGDFKDLPDGIRLYDFLPGSATAANASVVVCQGGIGTIYQALAAGKPIVGIPFMPEQEVYGIKAVEKLGAGLSVSARHLTPKLLAHAITEVQKNTKYEDASRLLQPKIDLLSGPKRAADVISSLSALAM